MLHHGRRISAGAQDPYFDQVALLLHGDGTNGATNSVYVDRSSSNLTINAQGNISQLLFSPYGNNWSTSFPGTSGQLTITTPSALQISSSAFCIEAWVYPLSYNTSAATICGRWRSASNRSYIFYYGSTGTLNFDINGGGGLGVGAGTVPRFQWSHVAVSRDSSSVMRLFLNGDLVTSRTVAASIGQGTNDFVIGQNEEAAGLTTWYMDGYISNLRVVIGDPVYTAAFTPPRVALTAIANTQLLTCLDGRFIDRSPNALTLTASSTLLRVRTYSPFSTQPVYNTGLGGSALTNNTARYLTLAANAATAPGSGAFTWQCWWYPIGTWFQNASTGGVLWIASTTSGLQIGRTDTGTGNRWGVAAANVAWRVTTTTLPVAGQWNHLAVVRAGTGTNSSAIFLNGVRVGLGTIPDSFVSATTNIQGTGVVNNESFGYLSDLRFDNAAVYDVASSTLVLPTAPLTVGANTRLLCNFDNVGVIDSSESPIALELQGNAQINTSIKRYGTGSLALDGTGDYINLFSQERLDLVPNSFTIESWIYPTSLKTGTSSSRIFSTGGGTVAWNSSGGIHVLFQIQDSTGKISLQISNNTATQINVSSTGTVSANVWTHVAGVYDRTLNQIRLYINGVGETFSVGTPARPSTNPTAAVGTIPGEAGGGGLAFQGYLDDLRLTQGVARYTSNFTPPACAFPDS